MSQPDQLPTPDPERPTTGGTPAAGSPAAGVDRRAVIRSAGIVGVGAFGAATLAACGGDSDTGTPTSKPAAGTTGSETTPNGGIKTADIPVGGGKVFDVQKVVVTQPKAGEFKAFSAICTHRGCTVSKVEDGTIDCACHGSKFDMTTGAVTSGPATVPLPSKQASESGGSITVA